MIRIFGGDDQYTSYLEAKNWAKKLSEKNGKEVVIINADDETSLGEILGNIEGVGLFSEEKIVLIKRLYRNSEFVKYFGENYTNFGHADIVVWEDKKTDGKLGLTKKAKKDKQLFIYEVPQGYKAAELIKKWLGEVYGSLKDLPITERQLDTLIEIGHFDKGIVKNMIEKILIFCNGMKNIDPNDFDQLVGTETNGNIWKFIEYFHAKNFEKLSSELDKLMKIEDTVFGYMGLLRSELTNLVDILTAKNTDGDFKSLGIHPFRIQNYMKIIGKYSFKDLNNLSLELIRLEAKIKSNKLSDVVNFKVFLKQWCSK